MSLATEYVTPPANNVGGELLIMRRTDLAKSNVPIILFHHGYGGNAYLMLDPASEQQWRVMRNLAEDGYLVCAGDFGLTLWGNGTNRTYMSNAVTFLRSDYGGHPSKKIGLVGASMGGVASLNYARVNPTLVAGCYLFCPVVNLVTLGGFFADVATAYPSINLSTSTENPINGASAGDYAGIPLRIWHAPDDTLTTYSDLSTFALGLITAGGADVDYYDAGNVGHGDPTAQYAHAQHARQFFTTHLAL